jgi:membrane protein YqaA with SNARE-associated domain
MERLVYASLAWFAIPRHGLTSVFLIAFVSATLLPLGSEPAVFGFVKLNPDQFWITVVVATLGNTLGGAVDYWMGFGAKSVVAPKREIQYLKWFKRLGPKALVMAWLPVVGDPLCAVAGWLQLPFWPSVFWMAVGKFTRYSVMTALLLWVPNAWWVEILKPIAGM